MHENFDFDGEAEMKTLQEVHDMLILTGYKEEAETVANAIKAIKAIEAAALMMTGLNQIFDICERVQEDAEAICK